MTNRTAATRYARALLDVAVKEGADLEQIDGDLAGFVDLVQQHPTLEKVLLNPAVPVQRKRAAMAELTARAGTSGMVAKLLVLLAERDRLVLLPELRDAYHERMLDHRNIVRARVTTVAALPEGRAQAIGKSLEEITGRTVIVKTDVDPSIIGGVIAQVGSTIYDGSVTRQLEKMKQRLVGNI